MHRTKHIQRLEHVSDFTVENGWELHNDLVELFTELGFKDIDGIDTPLPEKDGAYLFFEEGHRRIHVFVREKLVDLVFDTRRDEQDVLVATVLRRFPLAKL